MPGFGGNRLSSLLLCCEGQAGRPATIRGKRINDERFSFIESSTLRYLAGAFFVLLT